MLRNIWGETPKPEAVNFELRASRSEDPRARNANIHDMIYAYYIYIYLSIHACICVCKNAGTYACNLMIGLVCFLQGERPR